jgi:Tfp pilus assembly protein FimV
LYGEEMLALSVTEASKVYDLRHKSEQAAATYADRVQHLAEAPAIRRILTERLSLLQGQLTTQEASIKSLQGQLDAMADTPTHPR